MMLEIRLHKFKISCSNTNSFNSYKLILILIKQEFTIKVHITLFWQKGEFWSGTTVVCQRIDWILSVSKTTLGMRLAWLCTLEVARIKDAEITMGKPNILVPLLGYKG